MCGDLINYSGDICAIDKGMCSARTVASALASFKALSSAHEARPARRPKARASFFSYLFMVLTVHAGCLDPRKTLNLLSATSSISTPTRHPSFLTLYRSTSTSCDAHRRPRPPQDARARANYRKCSVRRGRSGPRAQRLTAAISTFAALPLRVYTRRKPRNPLKHLISCVLIVCTAPHEQIAVTNADLRPPTLWVPAPALVQLYHATAMALGGPLSGSAAAAALLVAQKVGWSRRDRSTRSSRSWSRKGDQDQPARRDRSNSSSGQQGRSAETSTAVAKCCLVRTSVGEEVDRRRAHLDKDLEGG